LNRIPEQPGIDRVAEQPLEASRTSRRQKEEAMKTIFAAAAFAATLVGFGAANAMPLAPLAAADSAAVIQVAQGCGPGWARGPMGRCRPMYRSGPVVVVRPRGVVVRPARVCPPGLVFRGGRCRGF